MTQHAFVLGGTGQIGRAVVHGLLEAGWEVTVGARTPADTEARFVQVDRADDAQLAAALGEGVDVLVDVIPMTGVHAQQLVHLEGRIGSVVAISSGAVYGLNQLTPPISESAPTEPPKEDAYAIGKLQMERTLVESGLPSTILRPGAVHGPTRPLRASSSS